MSFAMNAQVQASHDADMAAVTEDPQEFVAELSQAGVTTQGN